MQKKENYIENEIVWQKNIPKNSCRKLERATLIKKALLGKKVLDVGCGVGRLAKMLSDQGREVYGIDVETSFLKKAPVSIRGQLVRGSGQNLPFISNVFDTVVMEEVIEHLQHPSVAVQECHRVLKPEGHLILSTPNARVYYAIRFLLHYNFPYDHVREYTLAELRSLLMGTFKNVCIEGLNPYLPKFLCRSFPGFGIVLLASSKKLRDSITRSNS